jgi:hypothetical protein
MYIETDEIIEKFIKAHGEEHYSYDKVSYINKDTFVSIDCHTHGTFKMLPKTFIKGPGCSKCNKKVFDTEIFIEKSKAIFDDRYDYSKVVYTTAKNTVELICKEHGSFMKIARTHLRGKGCPICDKKEGIVTSFLKKANIKHNNKYDYSKMEYKSSKDKIEIICKKHGSFFRTPRIHLRNSGCPDCKVVKPIGVKKTREQFIEDAINIHGTIYDYSKVDYVKSSLKVIISCKEHGDFEQTPRIHLQSGGCPKCSGYSCNTSDIINEFKKIHGDKYDYSNVVYTKGSIPVVIRCHEHGKFKQRTVKHMNGQGCPKCAKLSPHIDTFIEKANKVHNNKYDYSKIKITNQKASITITCPNHGDFKQLLINHLSGCGCPKCKESYIDTDIFIRKSKEIHKDKYDYSKTIYTKYNDNIIITCPTHGDFRQVASNHLSGCGCPSCRDTFGFNQQKPAILYYLKIGNLYKIGITNNSVKERFKSDFKNITIIKEWSYALGMEAKEQESKILKEYKYAQYKGPNVLAYGGNTELFDRDILLLDN